MIKSEINGGNRQHGEISITGAKNAAVGRLPAALLVDGGRRTVRMRAKMAGEEPPVIPELTEDELSCIFTPADMAGLMRTVLEALSASLGQQVEAQPVKNAAEAPAAEASA